jgi:iron complex outermembrane recepter protein
MKILLSVMALLCLPRLAAAQAQADVVGRVIDPDNRPVAVAVVTVDGSPVRAQTDRDGRFRLRGVPVGVQRFRVTRAGYTPLLSETFVSGGAAEFTFTLVRTPIELAGVTVIGTPEEMDEVRARLREVPGAVALIGEQELQRTRRANLQDVLRLTPGVWVQSRFGAADESQLSIRGSGLRNNFHLRGVNVLVNGMPYRNADGFTDFESLELLTTEAIEVHKGGNALRFGGSTLGGAVNLNTKTGYTADRFLAFGEGGSFGLRKAQVSSGRASGPLDYYLSFARTSLHGYREWAEQGRDRVNAHLGYVISPGLDLRAFYFYATVNEQLPGALTRAEMDSNPRQAVAANVANRWGRNYWLHHLGLQLRAQLSPRQKVEVAPYFQFRDIDHPIFRVITQISRDAGVEARYENTAPIGGRDHRMTVGAQSAYGNLDDRQFDNNGGARGALRKEQRDVATLAAVYAEDRLALTGRLSTVIGLRYERSLRRLEDNFLGDGDQTDSRAFRALLPKVGLLFDAGPGAQLFANVSRSFEPPLILELNSLTGPGFVNLEAQDAWQLEIGTRGRAGRVRWDVAFYDIELRNEILNINVPPFFGAPFTVPTYRNADRTRHRGAEIGAELSLAEGLDGRMAYTLARNTFVRDSDFAGHSIPGAPTHSVQAELEWRLPAGLAVTPRLEWVPERYSVNSADSLFNRGWLVLGVRAEWNHPTRRFTAFAAVENLTDRVYAGSVQVDNAQGRYFEPADRRAVYAGFQWRPW